ncbi:MAG: glycosyltransferase [Rickettsiales bacterium]|nr:MAG: glycosyltransferase [Rickettsiales bacterium]
MKIKNLVSIIIATYNSEKYLDTCLSSIIKQSYTNYELIIIDGGSTDATLDIISEYESHIYKWISEPDKGVYDAWNKAMFYVRGEWISFVGSDDVLYDNYLETYINYITLNKLAEGADFISSKIDLVDENLNFIKTVGEPWTWKLFKKSMVTWHLGSFHSRTLFESYGIFDTYFKISGDYELLLRPKDNLRSSYINKSTAMMRNGGISSKLLIRASVETYKAKIKNGVISYIEGYSLMALDYVRLKIRHMSQTK